MTTPETAAAPSDRTRIRRIPTNAAYDTATLHAIVDTAYLCHIAFADDKGAHCIPTACWREGGTCTSTVPTAAVCSSA